MKKTYIEPKNTVVRINMETMVATSPGYGETTNEISGNLAREVIQQDIKTPDVWEEEW